MAGKFEPIVFNATGVTSALSGVTGNLRVVFNLGADGRVESVDVGVESLRLMLECLLTGAVNDYVRYQADSPLFENARFWLFSEDGDPNDPMCFSTCCAVLGLNTEKVQMMANWFRDRWGDPSPDKRKRGRCLVEIGKFLELCRR